MVDLLCHLHFWTLRALSPRTAVGGDIGTHKYHEKAAGSEAKTGFTDLYRRQWAESRGITWTPSNRKPEKLRDVIKDMEEQLSSHQPVCMKWKSLRHCLILLDSGILLVVTVARHSGDIERAMIDRTLLPRIGGKIERASVLPGGLVLCLQGGEEPASSSCGPVAYVSVPQHSGVPPMPLTLSHTDSGKRLEKLSACEPKISLVDASGMPSGNSGHVQQRNIITSCQHSLVAIWWRDLQEVEEEEEGFGRRHKAHGSSSRSVTTVNNIHIFRVTSSGKLEASCVSQTEFDPVNISFSKSRNSILYCLEKVDNVTYQSSVYEHSGKKLSRIFVERKITSESKVICCERNKYENCVLLGCEDGSLILQETVAQGTTREAKAFFSPISLIRWHPAGSLVFVCGSMGSVQCYDLALQPVMFQLVSEDPTSSLILDLSSYFMAPTSLEMAEWSSLGEGHGGCYDNFLMVFERGPLVLLRLELGVLSRGKLEPIEIVCEYIRHGRLDEAITLTCTLSWNLRPSDSFICLTSIMDHLLVQPLTAKTEVQMESTLAMFLSPETPISQQVRGLYACHVINLARRFFHLILRDVHFTALECGNKKLADMAKKKAEAVSSGDLLADIFQTGVLLEEDEEPFLRLDEEDMRHINRMSLLSYESNTSNQSPFLEDATQFGSSSAGTSPGKEEDCSESEFATQDTLQAQLTGDLEVVGSDVRSTVNILGLRTLDL